ncbi:sensor [Alteromonas sp. KUL17]|uniref:FecR family protein n=1 Tax=Alteromonas sp. KUL17 TaxID=2480796 RepID=UPI00103775C4|nr:FecR domain-containing protein [Alteromonas sp. KUL17]TAP29856.1 DUF4880 domain-containing protein [Alteromonas sp. KUL17]GEA02264.1 sensor [Alteromonas sp. KUL17]
MQVDYSQTPTTIELIATEWFVKLNSNELDVDGKHELEVWLNASETHRVAFEKVALLWQDTGNCDSLIFNKTTLTDGHKTKNVSFFYTTLSAAAMLIVCFLSFVDFPFDSGKNHTYRISSTFEGNKTLPLADGSVVTLSGNSQLDVDFTSNQRNIVLLSGTAHFQVSPDKTRPFTVYSKGIYTRAVGTAFQVKMDDDIQISVTEGTVAVGDTHQEIQRFIKISNGKQINVELAGRTMSEISTFDEKTALSWINGRFIYEDAPLNEIISDLNRYREKKLYVGNSVSTKIKIDASFDIQNIDSFLNGLAISHNIYTQETADRTVLVQQPGRE